MKVVRGSTLRRVLLVPLALSFLAACERDPSADVIETKHGALTSADVLGFEVTGQWRVTQGTVQSLALTDSHTQGAKALAVARPSGYTRLDSANLPSSNKELGEIDRGVSAVVDLMVPSLQANPYWFGAVQMYVSVPSKNQFNVYLGQVELTGMRTNVYSSLAFKLPDALADVLKGATYNDLSFGIVINVPLNSPGTYRLDNLRIRGKLPPAPTDETQIAEGQSILLEPWKTYAPAASKVAEKAFTQGIIQIPASFHPVKGKAGTGSATFAYRLGTGTLVTCQYPAQASGVNYVFGSCSNGQLAADLVPADFVRLTVVNGDAAAGKTRIKAQIALNPAGDEILAGMPSIPTFFGESAAEVAAALDSFVQATRNWNTPGKVHVSLPTPHNPPHDSIERNGTNLPPTRPPEDNDPPFALSGRLTNDDVADAGWHVIGSIAAPIDASGTRKTEFDIDIGADAWLLWSKFGNIVGVTGHAETTTPPPTGGTIPPTTATADFCYEYLGIGQSCAGPFDGSTGLNKQLFNVTPKIPLPSLTWWVFSVGASIDLTLSATLTGGFTPTGFALAVNPQASLGATLRGGVSAFGFVGGGLFVSANILSLQVPISASVNASLSLVPGACKIHISESLSAQAIVSSGSGKLGWYVEGGICCGCVVELCARTDGVLTRWDGYNQTFEILPASPLANQDIPLDVATFCPAISDAPGNIQYPVSGETFKQGDKSFMSAQFMIFVPDDNPANPNGLLLILFDNLTWTSSNPTDVINGNFITYGTPGPRLLSVVATSTGSPGAGSGNGSVAVNVVANSPAVEPTATIVAPAPGTLFDCATVNASATSTDPNGGTPTFDWYIDNEGTTLDPYGVPGQSVGTGANVSFPSNQGGDHHILRLIVTDPDGNKSMHEIPTVLTCIR
jgi:hypothetical protein